ncbi:hypothetical protein ACBJ59_01810 [Nonomuraea sp. MTCD27]|uniref:hypothetical protein n=1 Tax=Nonomuraea sp. MTCD27 TaxID=1676747 RepID=UPI0035C0DDDF
MMTVLGTIGSLVVVLLLVVLAVLLISAVAMVTLLAMAASMTQWRTVWRRLTRRRSGLELKLSGPAVPERLRAELHGSVSRVRRRFLLGDARPGERRAAERGGGPPRSRLHRRAVERHTRT